MDGEHEPWCYKVREKSSWVIHAGLITPTCNVTLHFRANTHTGFCLGCRGIHWNLAHFHVETRKQAWVIVIGISLSWYSEALEKAIWSSSWPPFLIVIIHISSPLSLFRSLCPHLSIVDIPFSGTLCKLEGGHAVHSLYFPVKGKRSGWKMKGTFDPSLSRDSLLVKNCLSVGGFGRGVFGMFVNADLLAPYLS